MTIILTAKTHLPGRVSLQGITPDKLAGLSAQEIAQLPILVERDQCALADIFAVKISGESDSPTLHINSDGLVLDHIGYGMKSGIIESDGAVGAYLGANMAGGIIRVRGDAEYGAGQAMMGGRIDIYGTAAGQIAAAKPGALSGMAGGILVVHGDVHGDIGLCMKRGLVVVLGDVHGMSGNAMFGGTIMVMGQLATPCGVAMRRGSILALGGFTLGGVTQAIPNLPSFGDCLAHDLGIVRLWQKEIAAIGLGNVAQKLATVGKWHKLIGDHSQSGIGEILFPN